MKRFLFYIAQNYSFAILRPIQKILIARGDKVCWFFEGDAVNDGYLSYEEEKLDTVEQIFDYNPNAVLAPAQSIPSFLPGLKVSVNHGFHIGKKDRKGNNDHFKLRGCFDLICTQGPDTSLPFKSLQKKYKYFNVIETGWSAIDPLFNTPLTQHGNDKPVILYCSTFSKRLTSTRALLPMIKKLSHTGKWDWLIQFHPKMDNEIICSYQALQGDYLTYVETDDIIPLLLQADVMVCDTSSVMPMFSLLNKPVVSYNNVAPGPQLLDINDPEKLELTINYALTKPQNLMSEIRKYNNHIHPYRDGKSSQRVIDAIDEVLQGKHPVKNRQFAIHIRNIIKNLKHRKRLNFWKLK